MTVYINRQSRSLDWFPTSDPGRYFDGVDIGFRYVKGHKGKGKNPGMSASIAKLRTLRPSEDHVLLLHCTKRAGFEELVKWYAGDVVLRVDGPPSATEITGDGPYTPLKRNTGSTSPEVGGQGDIPSQQSIDVFDVDVAGPANPAPPDLGTDDAISGLTEDGSAADPEDAAGGGWMSDPERRKAVEMHAVGMASARYASLGFLVEERGKPFDLLCTPTDACLAGAPTVHVEVKGSLGSAATVHLTRNEVADARGDGSWRSDLYIVSGIRLTQCPFGAWVAAGGIARCIEGWCPRDEDLTPTDYSYVVPR